MDLERIIFCAFKEALKDYYKKYHHGMMLMEFDNFTDKDIEELITYIEPSCMGEIIKSMANHLKDNYEIGKKENKMIKVENFVQCYEEDGKEIRTLDHPKVIFRSHWNQNSMVEIELPDGKRYTVLIKDVQSAIINSGNISRF